jgi:hypothetical protein
MKLYVSLKWGMAVDSDQGIAEVRAAVVRRPAWMKDFHRVTASGDHWLSAGQLLLPDLGQESLANGCFPVHLQSVRSHRD